VRETGDLASYPELVVIYLGMRANSLRGVKTLMGFGSKIRKAVAEEPEGLLLHENLMFSMFPPHGGMRQYWRDFQSLEKWARSGVHAQWWRDFLSEPGGAGFWHETYFRGGEIESLYIDMPPVGLGVFAGTVPARGSMFSARSRLGLPDEPVVEPALTEEQLYEQ
jgi:Domain of unknown function (DUF4188)